MDCLSTGGPDVVVCVNNMDKMGWVVESPMNYYAMQLNGKYGKETFMCAILPFSYAENPRPPSPLWMTYCGVDVPLERTVYLIKPSK